MTAEPTRSAAGAVYLEFLIAFVPIFLFFLGIVQLAFIASAKLVVKHAAVMGARSAIVVLEDDHSEYKTEGFGVIDYRGGRARRPSFETTLSGVQRWFGNEATNVDHALFYSRGGPRLRDIRFAVYMPLLAISPSIDQIGLWFGIDRNPYAQPSRAGESLRSAIGEHPELRFAAGLLYNRVAAAITFPTGPGADSFVRSAFGPNDTVTVRVTYLYPCAVPLASRFVCNSLLDIAGVGRSLSEIGRTIENIGPSDIPSLQQQYQSISRDLPRRAGRYRQIAHELSYAEIPGLLLPMMLTSTYFVALRAEASMPIQGADYYRR
ncbi:MAG: pilus assembly protein [Deltaproteobacteria bacterium]|nr:pilus assembly protein [Deltaproteobacteria bacterium]